MGLQFQTELFISSQLSASLAFCADHCSSIHSVAAPLVQMCWPNRSTHGPLQLEREVEAVTPNRADLQACHQITEPAGSTVRLALVSQACRIQQLVHHCVARGRVVLVGCEQILVFHVRVFALRLPYWSRLSHRCLAPQITYMLYRDAHTNT